MGRRSRFPPAIAGGVTVPFSPLDEPGSIIWLKGDTSGSFTMSGANILTWVDQSAGAANTFTAALGNPTKDAAGINGVQAVNFGGATTMTKSSFSGPGGGGEIFIVRRNAAAGAQVGLWTFGSDATGDLHPNNDTITYDGWGSTVRKSTVAMPVIETTANLYNVRSSPGVWIQSENDVVTFATGTNTVGWAATAALGLSAGGQRLTGWIGEVLMYNHILSSVVRGKVTTYLRTKWGV